MLAAALLEAGEEFGLLQGGARSCSTVAHESGWIPSPMPAVYSGEKMKPYREWLSGDGFEANASLGGSFVSDNIEDYYLTPWDLGYGHILNFDHDFVGRSALERLKDLPHRRKVTLIWNAEDVTRVFASLFSGGDRFKYMDIPASHYATLPYDAVLSPATVGQARIRAVQRLHRAQGIGRRRRWVPCHPGWRRRTRGRQARCRPSTRPHSTRRSPPVARSPDRRIGTHRYHFVKARVRVCIDTSTHAWQCSTGRASSPTTSPMAPCTPRPDDYK